MIRSQGEIVEIFSVFWDKIITFTINYHEFKLYIDVVYSQPSTVNCQQEINFSSAYKQRFLVSSIHRLILEIKGYLHSK